jgi:hypothetical protein
MKRRHLFAVGFILLMGGMFVYQTARTKEPRYQGRTLTQWLAEKPKTQNPFSTRPRPLTPDARRAVMAMGTNAIPVLLEMARATDSGLRTWVNSHLSRQRIIEFRFRSAAEQRAMAFTGFEILGEAAEAAAPALASLLKEPDVALRYTALESLRRVTSDKEVLIPLLLEACRDSSPEVRFVANTDLHFRSPDALRKAGIPDFLEELHKQATDDTSSRLPQISN